MDEPKPDAGKPDQQPKETSLAEQLAAMKAEIQSDFDKKYKSQMDGLNRRNTELEKELESEKKAHMKAEERQEYERKQYEQNITDREAALQRQTTEFHKMRLLAKYNLDESFMPRIQGEKPEEIEADIKSLLTFLDSKYVNPKINERLASGPKPAAPAAAASAGAGESPEMTLKKIAAMPTDDFKRWHKEHPDDWKALLGKYNEPVMSG